MSARGDRMGVGMSHVVAAVVALVAIAVVQVPAALCAHFSVVKGGLSLSCDVIGDHVEANAFGEWMQFGASLWVEAQSAGWNCKRAGLSSHYMCKPTVSSVGIRTSEPYGGIVDLGDLDITIWPGDRCAGCTACKQLLERATSVR